MEKNNSPLQKVVIIKQSEFKLKSYQIRNYRSQTANWWAAMSPSRFITHEKPQWANAVKSAFSKKCFFFSHDENCIYLSGKYLQYFCKALFSVSSHVHIFMWTGGQKCKEKNKLCFHKYPYTTCGGGMNWCLSMHVIVCMCVIVY